MNRDLVLSESQAALRYHKLSAQKWRYLTLSQVCVFVCSGSLQTCVRCLHVVTSACRLSRTILG